MYESVTGKFSDPNAVATHFHLREGDVVADFGAGSGFYMKVLSELVGRSGIVYLCEVQKSLVEALGIKARQLRLSNTRVLWGDFEVIGGTKINEGSLDAVILSNVLFQLHDKASAFQEVARTMKKGGKLFIIDWKSSFSGLGPQPEYVVIEDVTRSYAEQVGFVYERSFPTGEHHYGIALRKQ